MIKFDKRVFISLLAFNLFALPIPSLAADNTVAGQAMTAGALPADQLPSDLSESDFGIIRNIVRVELTDKEPGTVVPWDNSQSGNSGLVILQGTLTIENMACREVTYVLTIAGQTDSRAYNLNSCLRPDGSWMNLF